MQRSQWCEIVAIASREFAKADESAERLNIPTAYGSYGELLADNSIEAVYNPLPNHLHVPWTIKAAEAGKHVLCEKPVALDAAEARTLIDVRDRTGVRIQEAFMVRTHPQWLETRRLIHTGKIGSLRSITGFFSYFNDDLTNIRNQLELGGGALMDIGCYPITISRFITTAVLDFPNGHSTFTCSTRLAPYQRMIFHGTRGRIEVLIPFNAPHDHPTQIMLNDATIEFPICDQYEIQGTLFSRAIRENRAQEIPLEDAINNMSVIDAVFRSATTGQWQSVHLHDSTGTDGARALL
jgi:predicted dehydrogenase